MLISQEVDKYLGDASREGGRPAPATGLSRRYDTLVALLYVFVAGSLGYSFFSIESWSLV